MGPIRAVQRCQRIPRAIEELEAWLIALSFQGAAVDRVRPVFGIELPCVDSGPSTQSSICLECRSDRSWLPLKMFLTRLFYSSIFFDLWLPARIWYPS